MHERNVGSHATEVSARRERRLMRGLQDDTAHRVVHLGSSQSNQQLCEHSVRERVPGLGLIESDRGHASLGDLVLEGLIGQRQLAHLVRQRAVAKKHALKVCVGPGGGAVMPHHPVGAAMCRNDTALQNNPTISLPEA